jgi:hypothetical protein
MQNEGAKTERPATNGEPCFGKTPLFLEYQVQAENEPSILAWK